MRVLGSPESRSSSTFLVAPFTLSTIPFDLRVVWTAGNVGALQVLEQFFCDGRCEVPTIVGQYRFWDPKAACIKAWQVVLASILFRGIAQSQ